LAVGCDLTPPAGYTTSHLSDLKDKYIQERQDFERRVRQNEYESEKQKEMERQYLEYRVGQQESELEKLEQRIKQQESELDDLELKVIQQKEELDELKGIIELQEQRLNRFNDLEINKE